MCVCGLCLVVEGAGDIQVTHSFDVIVRNLWAAPYYNTDLELAVSLIADLELPVQGMLLMGDEIKPESDWTLGYFRLLDHQLMSLDRVIEDHVIFLVEGPVLKVDDWWPNIIVTENGVIIPDFDL